MPLPNRPQDPAFMKAYSDLVTLADAPVSNGPSTANPASARPGVRIRRVLNSLLFGQVSSFSGEASTLAGYSNRQNQRYNDRFLWDMYSGIQIPYLEKLPQEEPEDFQRRTGKATVNYLQLVVQTLCQNYKDAPQRKFFDAKGKLLEANNSGAQEINNIYTIGGFNASMLEVDRFCKLFGECLVRPVLDDDGNYRFAVYPKTDYELVIQNMPVIGMDGRPVVVSGIPASRPRIAAVVFRWTREELFENEMRLVVEHEVWTDKTFARFVDCELVEGPIDNPYGFIPYLHCTQTLNPATRFRQRDMLEDALLNSEFNNMLTLSDWHMVFAGMPITTVTDDFAGDEHSFKLVPGFVKILRSMADETKQARIEFLVPPDRVQSFKLKCEELLTHLFRSHGINYSTTEGIKAGVSGLAVEISMAPVLSQLKERAPVSIDIENRLYRLFSAIKKRETGQPLPEVARIDVEYAFSLSMRSAQDVRDQGRFELELGLSTREEVKMKMYPSRYASVEEARESIPDVPDVPLAEGSPQPGTGVENNVNGNDAGNENGNQDGDAE